MIDLSSVPFISVKGPSTDAKIKEVETKLGKGFPEGYIKLLKQTDGFASDEVRLYSVNEIEERNLTYEVDKYCPEFINIGDDGGGSAILVKSAAFAESKVYLVGHGVMTSQFMEVVGKDLVEWLEAGCPLEE